MAELLLLLLLEGMPCSRRRCCWRRHLRHLPRLPPRHLLRLLRLSRGDLLLSWLCFCACFLLLAPAVCWDRCAYSPVYFAPGMDKEQMHQVR